MDTVLFSGITKDDFLSEIKKTVKDATKEAFETLSNDKLLSQEEACEFLKISKTTIIDWNKKDKINPIKVGGRVYYKKSDLLNLNQKP